MARLPLQTLPTFDAVARTQNLRQAAAELHLTPSAVSQQIRFLETQLGFDLLERRGRGVVLNAAGAALWRAVGSALEQLHQGQRDATAAAAGEAHVLRLSLLSSFAQRWLLPRMGNWRQRQAQITLDLHTSQRTVDLQREGFHAALRQGTGPWRGLTAERLFESPLLALGSPSTAARLRGKPLAALAEEPLLGEPEIWSRWFALQGHPTAVQSVAQFSDSALMLQAAEQGLGIAMARELLAADALQDGRLVRLAPGARSLPPGEHGVGSSGYWLVYPPELAQWPPLVALRDWLLEELALSLRALQGSPPLQNELAPARRTVKPGKAAARRSKNQSRVP